MDRNSEGVPRGHDKEDRLVPRPLSTTTVKGVAKVVFNKKLSNQLK